MRRNLETITILCLTLMVTPVLCAQELISEDRSEVTAPTFFGEIGLFQTSAGSTVEKGRWTFSAYLNSWQSVMAPAVELAPPSARDYEDMGYLEQRFSASLGYGITDRWEVTLQLPIITIQGNDGDRAGYLAGYPYVGKFTDNGFGNLHLGTKFGLLSPENSHNLALTGYFDFNTGDADGGITSGNPDWGIGLAWNRGVYYASSYYMNRGRRDSVKTPEKLRFSVPNEFRADFGVNIPIRVLGSTNWITEINTIWYVAGERQPDDVVSLTTGLRHWMGNTPWGFSLAIRNNLTAAFGNSTAGLGWLGGIHYAPVRSASFVAPPPPPVPVPLPPPLPPPVQPAPVAEPSAPTELRSGNLSFDTESARVTNAGKALLDDVALRLRQEPAATLVVTGYVDSSESMGSGNDLDRRRAEAVRDYIVSRHNVDPSRITVEGGGVGNGPGGSRVAVVRILVR